MGFLSFIFFTVLAFYILGWIGRLLFGWWLRKKQRQMEEQLGQAGGYSYKKYNFGGKRGNARGSTRPEGEVVVETAAAPEKKVNRSVGEYVDFEEVEMEDTE